MNGDSFEKGFDQTANTIVNRAGEFGEEFGDTVLTPLTVGEASKIIADRVPKHPNS